LLSRRSAAVLALTLLAAYVAVRGIMPALQAVNSDFPNYLTAAKIVADRAGAEHLYDDSWFQAQMRHYGFAAQGKFAPFPPPTALLMLPLVRLEPLAALRVMTLISALGLLGSIILLARILSWSIADTGVFVLLAGYALTSGFRLGQVYVLVSATCILGYYAYSKGRPWLAGVSLGVFAPEKYFPLILLTYFASRREWRVALGGSFAIALIVSLSIATLGWQIHRVFLNSILGSHLTGHLSLQSPFSVSFQSFDSLFRRLFVYDAVENPRPWLELPTFASALLIITKAAFALAAIATLLRLTRLNAEDAVAPSIGILGILTLLLAPATAGYHLVLLWLPAGLLVAYLFRCRARKYGYVVLCSYALLGLFPSGFTARFVGRGALNVLAFPRLWLLTLMFCAGVCFIWRRTTAFTLSHSDVPPQTMRQ
jgi:hypothetical protein